MVPSTLLLCATFHVGTSLEKLNFTLRLDLNPGTRSGERSTSTVISPSYFAHSLSDHGGYTPRHSLIPGATVRLTSKAHGKNLRIHQNGAIDGRGGTGQWTTFHPNKFIAIKNNSLTHGTGGKFCILIVKHHPGDGSISLESAEHRSQHVGILPNGDPKGPHHTGTGDHGKFYVN